MYDWKSGLLDELAGMYVERLGEEPLSIRLFGSVARGDEKFGSDVDLLLTLADRVDLQEIEEAVTEIDLYSGHKLG